MTIFYVTFSFGKRNGWFRDLRSGELSLQPAQTELKSALDWYGTMPDPLLLRRQGSERHLDIRRYAETPPEMNQPALRDNLICMHLGGAKEVRRWHGGRLDVHTVDIGALTFMPAHQTNRWLTRGPVDFAHITLSPELVGNILQDELSQDPRNLPLFDRVGLRDPFLEGIFRALLTWAEDGVPTSRLYADSLIVVLIVALWQNYSAVATSRNDETVSVAAPKGGLPPWKLRRVLDYLAAHLDVNISLADLSSLVGLSRAQFFRAFKQSVGATPHRYLTDLRLEAARTRMDSKDPDIERIASSVGLSATSHFGQLFRRRFGLTPRAYLASRR